MEADAASVADQKAHLEVKTSGLGDYLSEIIRIESIRAESGKVLYERPLFGKYLKKIDLPAPGNYTFKILCERWYRLEFEHPIAFAHLEPDGTYRVTCKREQGKVEALVNKK